MTLKDLKGKKVGVCVSGGLDSKTVTKRFIEAGLKVSCFSADLGQPDEKNINDIITKMAPCGAETTIIDLKKEMAEACFDIVKAGATYDGGYWNTTGLARAVTVKGLVKAMTAKGIEILAHGATGRGNDQMRFERYTRQLNPNMDVYAPWRDAELLKEFPGRTQMVKYLAKFKIRHDLPGTKKKYSTDANLAGLSHEAEDLEHISTSCLIVDPTMGVWPQQAPDKIEDVTFRYKAGRCVEINGKKVTPLKAITLANDIGGRNGVWMKNALENRIIGTKSRGVYEAPGLEILHTALKSILQATLDRNCTSLYAQMSRVIAQNIYDGRYFDMSTRAAQACVDTLTANADGVVTLGLYKGNIFFQSMSEVPGSLYNEADSSMEESKGLNPVSSQGYADILAVEALSMARAGHFKGMI